MGSDWPHFTKHYPDCWSICGPNSVGRRYRLGVKEAIIPNYTDSLTPKDLDENSNGKSAAAPQRSLRQFKPLRIEVKTVKAAPSVNRNGCDPTDGEKRNDAVAKQAEVLIEPVDQPPWASGQVKLSRQ